MTDGLLTFAEFEGMVENGLNTLQLKINEGVNGVQAEFSRRIEAIPDWEWIVKPWLRFAVDRGVDALQEQFNKIWDAFEEKKEEIWKKVSEIQGDPIRVSLLSNSYIAAGRMLTDVGDSYLPDAISRVHDAWPEGKGPDAFGRQAPKQATAALGAASGLTQAAIALSELANKIVATWKTVHDALLDYASKVVDAINESTDAAKILTCDLGPAIKIVLDAAIQVVKLASDLLTYVVEDVTAGATKWKILESGNELAGLLAGNAWPKIAGLDGREMINRGNW